MKTQPHSHQNSQSNLRKTDKIPDDYFSSIKIAPKSSSQTEQFKTQPQTTTNKVELNLKQRVEQAVQEIKQRQTDDLL